MLIMETKGKQIHEAYKETIRDNLAQESQTLTEKIQSSIPKQNALLMLSEHKEEYRAYLNDKEIIQLWARERWEKYQALIKVGFKPQEALALVAP